MGPDLISKLRLYNQQISHSHFETPAQIVHHMVAMQAQDFLAALWAVGLRGSGTSKIRESDVEKAIAEKQIVRTWPMRGTLHFTAAQDAKWLLRLLTPRIIKSSAGRHRQLELSETDFTNSRKLIEKALQGGRQLTRDELYDILNKKGISTEGQRGYHILWYLAQNAVICFGPRRGKQHMFVLFDDWILQNRSLNNDEALAELASRYIKSRGPVTEYDFANWSGLKVTTSRNAFYLVEKHFERVKINNQTYWFPDFPEHITNKSPVIHLLPSFDEIICGYKDKSAILPSDQEKSVILKNGIIKPIILNNGRAIGIWNRTLKKETVLIKTDWFYNLPATNQGRTNIIKAAKHYGFFLGLNPDIDLNQK